MRMLHAIGAFVAAAALCLVAAGCGADAPAVGGASPPASATSPAPDPTIAWAGLYSADDGRSIDPHNGYGGPLTFRLAVSTLRISRHGDRYVGVIATPSLAHLPPNTLVSNRPRAPAAPCWRRPPRSPGSRCAR